MPYSNHPKQYSNEFKVQVKLCILIYLSPHLTNNVQVYVFEKADVPDDEDDLDKFVSALMEFGVSLFTFKDMSKPLRLVNNS